MKSPKQTNTELEYGKFKMKFAESDKPLFKVIMMLIITLPLSVFLVVIAIYVPQAVASKTFTLTSGAGLGFYGVMRGIKLFFFKQ